MKHIFLFLSILLSTSIIAAEKPNKNDDIVNTKLISGKVIDKISGEEIAGAKIEIDNKIVYTDLSGNFSTLIKNKNPQALITSISYKNTKVNISPNAISSIVIELESQ